MRYVILRDDDTNGLTPVECLERLYRPFLDRKLPVNLAVIPNVRTDATSADGRPERFLPERNGDSPRRVPIASHPELVCYLRDNPGYHVAQHGYDHSFNEFESSDCDQVAHRLEHGAKLLVEAGFPKPETFIAPYDKFSRESLTAAARRYHVLSAGWFELRRLPLRWWPKYILKKSLKRFHWRAGGAVLLSHPGCLLSYRRPCDTMLDAIKKSIESRRLTVIVTHWWEYFRSNQPDEAFIHALHSTAAHLAERPDLKVVTFADVARHGVPID